MAAVQILMEKALIAEIDAVAKRKRIDRSKLIRAAIKGYLVSAQVEEWEQNDIDAYRRKPLTAHDLDPWQKVRVWPEE